MISHSEIEQSGTGGDERQTGWTGAATALGRGADGQAEQNQCMQGVLRSSSAKPPGREGVMLHRARGAGWKLRMLRAPQD